MELHLSCEFTRGKIGFDCEELKRKLRYVHTNHTILLYVYDRVQSMQICLTFSVLCCTLHIFVEHVRYLTSDTQSTVTVITHVKGGY